MVSSREMLLAAMVLSFICGCTDTINCPGGKDSWGSTLYPDNPEGIIVFENLKYGTSENRTVISGTVRNVSSSNICISQVYVEAWDTDSFIDGTTKILWMSAYNVPYRQRPMDSGQAIEFTFDANIDNSKVGHWEYYAHAWF